MTHINVASFFLTVHMCCDRFVAMNGSVSHTTVDANVQQPSWRLRRRSVAWLCLFCLSLNILSGAFLSSPSAAKFLGQANGFYQICTAAGLIEIDAKGRQIPAESTSHGSDICVFCLPLLHGGINAPTVFVIAEAELLASGAIFPAAPFAADSFFHPSGSSGPRAPPIF